MNRTLMSLFRSLILAGVLCARAGADDTSIHLPPQYNTFVPPAVGVSYTDPVFGVAIKRASNTTTMINNAVGGPLTFVSTEYPTASPFNSNNTSLLLQHAGYFGLYDGDGDYVRDLAFAANAATEPRWSRTDPNVLYYVSGNKLMKLTVSTGVSTTVRAFPEYSAIRGRGESDISRDGDHFVFAGDEPGGLANRWVFTYEISTNTKGAVLDTTGHPFNQLYLAPDNSVAIGWLASGTARFNGVELFNSSMVFQRQLTRAIGHMHLTRDTNNADVLIWTNSDDPQPIANCQNGIVKVRLSNAQQTCLLQLDWSLAVHITAGDGNGWVFVETYDPSDPPATAPPWKLYTNEILQVKLDGSEVRRLFHHRSRQTANYGYQPRAAVSRDGTRLVFTSNYNLQSILSYPASYTDAYFVAVPTMVPPRMSINDVSAIEGNSGTTTYTFTVSLTTASDLPISVRYDTADLTATSPSDYTSTTGTLNFTAGQTSKTIAVTVKGDTTGEFDETFRVVLSEPMNVVIADGIGVGTIINNDPAPSVVWTNIVGVTTNGASLTRGSSPAGWNAGAVSRQRLTSGNGYVEFTASETNTYRMAGLGNGDSSQDFADIEYAIYLTGGGQFFVFESGTAKTSAAAYASGDTFRVGVEAGVVKYRRNGVVFYTSTVAPVFPLLVDTSLYSPGATITDAQVLGLVIPPPAFSIADATITEGDSGTDGLVFTIAVNPVPEANVTVDWATSNATATAPSDYQTSSGTVTFTAGQTNATISVPIVGDATQEPNETFLVTLSDPTGGAVIADGQATGTIVNNDGTTPRSRLMFHNFVTNRLYRWHMKNGNQLDTYNWVTPYATDPGWTVGSTADFDGDGQLDYLWHNIDDGRMLIWYINGDDLKGFQFLPYTMPPPWRVAATFDANGNLKPDIVFYNSTTGALKVKIHDNAAFVSEYDIAATLPSGFRVVTRVDTNKDGDDELMLYNASTGQIRSWNISGANVTGTFTYANTQVTDPVYDLVSATTDFNNDGLADILWHNPTPTGVFSVWLMNGTTRLGTAVFEPFTATDPVWKVVGSANIW